MLYVLLLGVVVGLALGSCRLFCGEDAVDVGCDFVGDDRFVLADDIDTECLPRKSVKDDRKKA